MYTFGETPFGHWPRNSKLLLFFRSRARVCVCELDRLIRKHSVRGKHTHKTSDMRGDCNGGCRAEKSLAPVIRRAHLKQ